MKKTYWKGCLRDLGRSKSRFIAIVAIVALGAGFFGGIKATSIDMKLTADNYYKECDLYDFRLVSSLGITQKDAQAIAALDGVSSVMPSYQADAIIQQGDSPEGEISSDTIVRLHSLPREESINRVVLVEGRLPEASDECVVVAKSTIGSAFQIGDVIAIDQTEDPDIAEELSVDAFTVVGLVNSPLYMSIDSSSSSKGSGTVNSYAFIPESAFEMEAYTELYLALDESKTEPFFSSEYETLIRQWEQTLKDVGVERCEIRRAEVVDEATQTLDEARREYEDAKADAQEQLADAKQQLDDARQEIADGEKELADGKAELEDARQQLADGEAELADGEVEYREQIADAERQLQDAQTQIEENEQKLEDAWDQLRDALRQLEAGEQEYEAGLAEFEGQKAAVYQQIEDGVASAIEQINQSPLPEEQKQLLIAQAKAAGEEKKAEADAQFAPIQAQLDSSRSQLDRSWSQYYEGRAEAVAGDETLAEGRQDLAKAQEEFETQKAEGAQKLEDARQELADARQEIADGEAKLADAEIELADARQQLADGEAEYEEKKAEADRELSDAYEEILDAEEEIADIETPEWYVLDRDTNAGYAGFSQDTERIDAIAMVFPVFFFLVAALVCLTTMTRMIEEERTQIGVLKALGYGKGIILAKYLFYAAITSLIGSVLGLLIGFQVFPRVIWAAYGIMYTTPPILTPFNWTYAIIATAVFLVCTIGATFAACWGELMSVPATLIRPKPPKSGKRVLLERIPFLWKHLTFSQKLTARNILRYKKRFFMTVVGVAGCTALMLTGFGLKDSINGIVTKQFGELFHYDMQLTLSHDLDPEHPSERQQRLLDTLSEDERITGSLLVHQENTTAVSKDKQDRMDAYIVVPEDTQTVTEFITFQTRRGKEPVPFPQEGALISEKLSNELHLGIGDELTLEDADNSQVSLPVAGIIENYVYNYVYLSPDQYAALYQEDCLYSGVFATISEPGNAQLEDALSSDLLSNSEVMGVSYIATIINTFTQVFDRLDLVVLVLIVSASLLAFIVLYNLTNININERIREIATIKVLGFYNNEVDRYVYRENIVLTLIGMLVGFAGGVFLHQYVMRVAEVNIVMFGREILPLSYLWAGLLTLVFAAVVNFVMHFRLKRISMVESLKSIE